MSKSEKFEILVEELRGLFTSYREACRARSIAASVVNTTYARVSEKGTKTTPELTTAYAEQQTAIDAMFEAGRVYELKARELLRLV